MNASVCPSRDCRALPGEHSNSALSGSDGSAGNRMSGKVRESSAEVDASMSSLVVGRGVFAGETEPDVAGAGGLLAKALASSPASFAASLMRSTCG